MNAIRRQDPKWTLVKDNLHNVELRWSCCENCFERIRALDRSIVDLISIRAEPRRALLGIHTNQRAPFSET